VTDTVEILAINLARRELLTTDDLVLPIADIHAEDGSKLDDFEGASFVTFQLPNGKWSFVHLSDFEIGSWRQ
jgi:hypothetical protein